ncbi:MAG: 50S ribosomal protein L15 [Spirochaetaceae bacterium]|jgi:large subunit ribosomal protein L15|nr:50S ribosomal protein L15 [Spirochaetaceae bacterium]
MHDFDLHAPKGANKKKRIVGRGQGSGRGTTAGRGNKGQQSRSGGKTYLGFEGGQMPLYRRLARRGFSNYPFKTVYRVVNLFDIEKRFEDGATVDVEALKNAGLVKGRLPVKILGNGKFTKKIDCKIDALSASAREKILKAGGSVKNTVVAEQAGETSASASSKTEET